MKRGVGLSLALLLCGAAQAGDPPARAQPPKTTVAAAPTVRKPLDLRVGDVRKYMMPNQFRAAIAGDADKNTVVVEGDRPAPPLNSTQPLPQGLLAYYSLVRHPASAWRMFLPDPNRPADGPTVDKVPPPIFRWGP